MKSDPKAMEPSARRRLGLFGGSFDPVHVGHVHVARSAQAAFQLDRVVFVPAARPPHKPGRVLAGGEDRLAMLEVVCAEEERWCTSSLELRRAGPSYTMDTVRELAKTVGEPEDARMFLILGSDNLPGLPQWSRVEELLERVDPIVVYRVGDGREVLDGLELSESALAKLRAGFLELPPVEVSSTGLRAGISTGEGKEVDVPPKVWEYIAARGLYTTG